MLLQILWQSQSPQLYQGQRRGVTSLGQLVSAQAVFHDCRQGEGLTVVVVVIVVAAVPAVVVPIVVSVVVATAAPGPPLDQLPACRRAASTH